MEGSDNGSIIIELQDLSNPDSSRNRPTEADVLSTKSSSTIAETRAEGHFWAYATLLAAFLIQFCTVGQAWSFGVYQDLYVREFLATSSSSNISWIGSTQSFLHLTLGLFSGYLFDKGYCHHLIISGACLFSLSMFMLSLAKPEHYYQVFLTQALGQGIGGGLAYTPSLAVLSQHFTTPDSRARAMAIAAAGTPIGGLVHPLLLNELFHNRDEEGAKGLTKAFALGTRANAGLVTGLLVIAVLLIRPNYQRKDAEGMSEEDREKEGHERKPMEFKPMVKRFARDWAYVFFIIGMSLYEMVCFFPSFYLQLKAVKAGLDPTFAFYTLCILNGAAFFGRMTPGFLTKTLGVANMFTFSCAAATGLIFCMLIVQSVGGVTAFAVFYGFFSGALLALMTPMLALLAESPAEIGARMGMCFAFSGLGSLIGTPIAGALLTSRFFWWRPIIFSGALCVVGLVLFSACRVMLGRRKGSIWNV